MQREVEVKTKDIKLKKKQIIEYSKKLEVSIAELEKSAKDNEKLHAEILLKATTDQLTGLYNRHHFNSQLHQEIARANRNNENLSCLIIDVDDFKHINGVVS